MENTIKKVQQLIAENILYAPMDGNHGEKHPKTTDYVDTGIPFILVPDLKNGRVDLDNCNHISIEQAKTLNKGFSITGDVLFTHKATIGKVAIVDTKDNDYIILTPQVTYYRIKNANVLFNQYLFYYFQCQTFLDTFKSYAASGGTRDYLGIVAQQKLPIIYPNIIIQKKIAAILSVYDNLIEVNNKRIKVLEQMAENLYKEWFVRFRFPGYETAEFENGLPKGWISVSEEKPKNWHYGTVAELGQFVRGRNITSDEMVEGDIPVISAGLEPSGYHNESNVIGKSITISASGANAGFMKYNLDDIWAADCSYMVDSDSFWFIYNSLKFIQPVISNLQCGAAQPHVYPKHINKLCIIIPEQKFIEKFCDIVSPNYDEIGKLKKKNDNLIKQRDLLLPRLMSGKLEV